ncbi:uncharacterized protein MCYG_04872 [Microsporum canis CBS 113480]|uniref:Uncharacterized protein n=1 Tax=Arthroderma otae (strain ATCC MYA-4605 / CBS 113480) TaxID=554155 RepID=C5FQA0_ARTOC|nr:uncharacterized protein MCYG_04872 [Microsporum canis CBS 113480]EEQ32053.1 predicted protein [Microsporum canis CBS 113480]
MISSCSRAHNFREQEQEQDQDQTATGKQTALKQREEIPQSRAEERGKNFSSSIDLLHLPRTASTLSTTRLIGRSWRPHTKKLANGDSAWRRIELWLVASGLGCLLGLADGPVRTLLS